MSERIDRRQFAKSLLAALGGAGIALIAGQSATGLTAETDPRAILLNPSVPQTVFSAGMGAPLTLLDLGTAEVGPLRFRDGDNSHAIHFLCNDNNHNQIRMIIDTILAPTAAASFLSFGTANGLYLANCVAFDPTNQTGLGINTLILGDSSPISIQPNTVPKIAFLTDPGGALDFTQVGSGGVLPNVNGASVGPLTAPAPVAGKPIGAGHSHSLTAQFQVSAYLDNPAGNLVPPVRIARWRNITTPITARRLSVLAQVAPVGGTDTYELTDLTTTLQVTLGAGVTENESSALTTRNFSANSVLYFRLVSSTATTQAEKVNLIADYTMNG